MIILRVFKNILFNSFSGIHARTENQGTDSAAITPADSVVEEFNTFDDLLAVKKIAHVKKITSE